MGKKDDKTDESTRKEIRIALVLYGGVSLAVYENGVTRCFHDLVRGQGAFKILLELADASAVVDVVAGTSAGGINGLFLAAALESGRGFKKTAELWRDLADIGVLLGGTRNADQAQSLLDGEHFHDKLVKAFEDLCKPCKCEAPNPRTEMDVLVAATDLYGHERRYVDCLKSEIADKEHRVVFHLKHRPGRKSLGFPKPKCKVDSSEQAALLGAIARITASFPAAFTPVSFRDFKKRNEEKVWEALHKASNIPPDAADSNRLRCFVDGGVLDNKPFAAALRAIFYRMPLGKVDRRLFYVEPDPESSLDQREFKEYSPVGVALASLSSIPRHEGISDDLERLIEHNYQVRWLRSLRKEIVASDASRGQCHPKSYLLTRRQSIARFLASNCDTVPSSRDFPRDARREQLLDLFNTKLAALDRVEGELNSLDALNSLDFLFQIRRACFCLYEIYDEAVAPKTDPKTKKIKRIQLRKIGRIIKLLKIILESQLALRDCLIPAIDKPGDQEAVRVLELIFQLLCARNRVWVKVRDDLKAEADQTSVNSEDRKFLESPRLSDLVNALRSEVADICRDGTAVDELPSACHKMLRKVKKLWKTVFGVRAVEGSEDDPNPEEETFRRSSELTAGANVREAGPHSCVQCGVRKTILDSIGDALSAIVTDENKQEHLLESFDAADTQTYPLEFASGLYELDEIEFVRISPADAQVGLSKLAPEAKISGDDLAHFSAFFRRDWRSNDLLQGRLDGICQIIRTLLNDDVIKRATERGKCISNTHINDALPGCPKAEKMALLESWKNLDKLRNGNGVKWSDNGVREVAEDFRNAMVLAGQCQAFCEEVETIYRDIEFQDRLFGEAQSRSTGQATKPYGNNKCGKKAWKAYKKLGIGSESIFGPDRRLPLGVLGEYVSIAYLKAWGMLRRSAGGRAGQFLDRPVVRWIARTPVAALYNLFRLIQGDRRVAVALISLLFGILIGVGGLAWFTNQWVVLVVSIGLVVLGLYVLARFHPRSRA